MPNFSSQKLNKIYTSTNNTEGINFYTSLKHWLLPFRTTLKRVRSPNSSLHLWTTTCCTKAHYRNDCRAHYLIKSKLFISHLDSMINFFWTTFLWFFMDIFIYVNDLKSFLHCSEPVIPSDAFSSLLALISVIPYLNPAPLISRWDWVMIDIIVLRAEMGGQDNYISTVSPAPSLINRYFPGHQHWYFSPGL